MYSKLLIPLDGSHLSERILPYARTLSKGLKIPVELLQVIEPDTIAVFSHPRMDRYLGAVEADMKRNSADYLKRVAGSFPNSRTTKPSVEIGNPAEVIVDAASADRGTLIAMSTHGRSGLERWFLGSVANKVLRASSNPVLLVRATDEAKAIEQATLKTVLVPLDGSPLAELALPHAVEMAKKMKLEIILIRVHSLVALAHMTEEDVPDLQKVMEDIKQEATGYVEEKVGQLRSEGLDRVSYALLEGDAAGSIIDRARDTSDSLVVMCTHGRSGIGRWVLGSVTDRVVRRSGDPVLVIRSSNQK